MSFSSQMVKSPRAFNAALYAFQFVVRYRLRPQLDSLIWRAYRTAELELCNNAVTHCSYLCMIEVITALYFSNAGI